MNLHTRGCHVEVRVPQPPFHVKALEVPAVIRRVFRFSQAVSDFCFGAFQNIGKVTKMQHAPSAHVQVGFCPCKTSLSRRFLRQHFRARKAVHGIFCFEFRWGQSSPTKTHFEVKLVHIWISSVWLEKHNIYYLNTQIRLKWNWHQDGSDWIEKLHVTLGRKLPLQQKSSSFRYDHRCRLDLDLEVFAGKTYQQHLVMHNTNTSVAKSIHNKTVPILLEVRLSSIRNDVVNRKVFNPKPVH